ncbi:MAG: metallophosphoesterase [Deltaproteobacteria bacterium]|nr:metallophosphoesterase [Deltaproteobacteria bacterium]MBN2671996.1 metallophosphoesterase [Deltaproteobacteria bacterium]
MSHTIPIILFALAFTSVIGGLQYYIWRRLIHDTQLKTLPKRVATVVIILLTLSIPLSMILSRTLTPTTARLFSFTPMLWLGTTLFLVSILIIVDIFFLIRWFRQRKQSTNATTNATAPASTTDLSRRTTLKRMAAMGTLGVSGALTGVSFWNTQKDATVIRQSIPLAKFPPSMNGFTIAQISDIHIGLTIGKDWLEKIVRQVNELNPDLIVITGDLIDGYVDSLCEEVAPLQFLNAPHGVFFVTGNHEYYFKAHQWISHLKKMNINVLENRSVRIENESEHFVLAGVNDYHASSSPEKEGPDLQKALANRPSDSEVILLCHQPKVIFDAAKMDVGLVLSGHTHGGQIWPFNLLVRLQQPYNKGKITGHRRTVLYINQGTGYWGPPMRLGTTSEITLFTLSNKGK